MRENPLVMLASRAVRSSNWAARLWPALLGAGWLVCVGCASEEEPTSTELYCEAVCQRAVDCGQADESCSGACRESVDLEPLRADAAEAFSECFRSDSCAWFGSEETWRRCWHQMQGSVAASEYGRQFCRTYATYLYGCGYNASAEACEENYGIFTNEALERLLVCHRGPCEDLTYCEERQLWRDE